MQEGLPTSCPLEVDNMWTTGKRERELTTEEMKMYRNQTAQQKNFATLPRGDIPRSRFKMRQTRKMAFNASELIPIMCEEVLPGDTWQHTESIMARLATPIAPVIDDLDIETFYFAVPIRIIWPDSHEDGGWEKFITGQEPDAVVPTIRPMTGGGLDPTVYEIKLNGLFDHFGLLPQVYTAPAGFRVNVLPIWAYFTIYNEWFMNQNVMQEWTWPSDWTNNESDNIGVGGIRWQQECLRVTKRPDYFTRSLPWPQKGDAVTIPLGTVAPVVSDGTVPIFTGATWPGPSINSALEAVNGSANVQWSLGAAGSTGTIEFGSNTGLQVLLDEATAATINSFRLAYATQKLLELDARGGSRYVENLMAHWGIRSPDYRLQRPEYLGGSKIPVTVNPIAQTATYDAQPDDSASAVGNLGAEMHASGSKRTFTYAATEHCYIIGLAVARATPTYQQGTRRLWRRDTRLSFYDPVFANLGEQAVDTRELYQPANDAPSNATWGYQERWAEMRYTPNEITGVLRSTAPQPLDWWHYSEHFENEPTLNFEFMLDKTQEVLARSLATAPSAQWSAQIIMDVLHQSTVARLMPTYSVPGLNDRAF